MKQPNLVSTALMLTVLVVAAILSLGCDSGGMAVGVGAPTRWVGGTTGPPVFIGGPTF
jgi:hypothetical protein